MKKNVKLVELPNVLTDGPKGVEAKPCDAWAPDYQTLETELNIKNNVIENYSRMLNYYVDKVVKLTDWSKFPSKGNEIKFDPWAPVNLNEFKFCTVDESKVPKL